MRLLHEIVEKGAQKWGERVAVCDAGGQVSYRGLGESAERIAAMLATRGVRPGDRCAILLPNGVDFVCCHFGILRARAISVPLDAAATTSTFESVAANCEPTVLFTDRARYDALADSIGRSSVKTVVVSGECEFSENHATPVLALGEVIQDGNYNPPPEPVDGEETVAALMYTTGTTSRPKGVQLTHRNVFAALDNICDFVGYTEADREVVTLPLSHNFGLGHLYCNLYRGGSVYLAHGLARVGRVLKALEEFRATGFPGTPMGFGMLIDRFGPVLAEKGRRLRFVVVNSAPMPPGRTAQLQALLPDTEILVYYGLTEASRSTFISLSREGPDDYASVGPAMPGVRVEVMGNSGKILTHGETGEVVIQGPTLTCGYWNNPEETAKNLGDGWLRTGDQGYLDERGYLFITGRLKDEINCGGYKVNPGEVEVVLLEHPAVVDVGVVGIAGIGGSEDETVVAAIVKRGDAEFGLDELERWCAGRLERFKVPTAFREVAEIPRSDTGKIKRGELARVIAGDAGAGETGMSRAE